MAYKYSYEGFNKETMGRASSTNQHISLKKTVETANAVKGKKVETAISYLEKVMDEKVPVPYKRYTMAIAHRPGKGISTGGYPVNVAKEIIRLLKAASKNAKEQEVSGELYVISVSGRKGTTRYHPGRYQGRKMKSTNMEVIVGSRAKKETKKKVKTEVKKEVSKKWLREK